MSRPAGGRPVVTLLITPGAGAALRPLVGALARRTELRAGPGGDRPGAVLASDPGAARRAPEGVPVAVVDGGRLLVGGADPVDLPAADGVRTAAWPPVAPHVRRRWRERLGLPPDLVVDVATLDPSEVTTALAVAAAARVGRSHLPLALALGCPTATDAAAAAAVGAQPGDQVVVGGVAEARALAADDALASRLSRRAAELARARDPDQVAGEVLVRLGLVPDHPVTRTGAALDELGTAPGASPRARTADALALFTAPDPGRIPPVHPAIDPDRAARLAGTPPSGPEIDGSVGTRARTAVRRLGGAVLDRVGDRAAAATGREVAALRDELERTRAELEAEIALLRAELEGRGAGGPDGAGD